MENQILKKSEKQEAIDNFDAAVRAEMTGGVARRDALAKAMKKYPRLHRKFLQATHKQYRGDE
jgi:hypothetical protein